MKQKKFKQKRKPWYNGLKRILKLIYKKPKFIYLGEKPTNSSIILSNHVSSFAPLTLEIYTDYPIRIWGTDEMNSGIKKLYKYQTEIYYHQKKKWNLHFARFVCLIVSPLTNLFYKGLNLISTYPDTRLRKTLEISLKAIKEKGENIIIFPEDSSNGYFDEIQKFYAGFVLLAEHCLKNGIDVPIFVSYFQKKERNYIFDKPVKYSELKAQFNNRYEIAEHLKNRCNELGRMDFSKKTK